ncbi:MAG: YdjY domain-containing protein [Akkermansiaceae bacterium]
MLKPLLLASLICLTPSYGQEPGTAPVAPVAKPDIKQINDHQFQIGKILLDQKKREISFGAGINMTQGLLEFLLVTTKSNKVHETLLLSDISPLNLNIAFKLLGIAESPELFEIVDEDYRPTGVYPEVDPKVTAASKIDIIVEWGEGESKKSHPINELIHHIEWPKEDDHGFQPQDNLILEKATLSTMEAGPWLSTGSYIHEGQFKAEVDGIMFAIYTSQQAIVNFPGKDRQAGDVWIPNEKIIQEEGTVVKIIIKPHQP